MTSDSIAGAKVGGIGKTLFLLPGRIIQWFMYMGVGTVKGYGKVRAQSIYDIRVFDCSLALNWCGYCRLYF